jgi:hypothetical protein
MVRVPRLTSLHLILAFIALSSAVGAHAATLSIEPADTTVTRGDHFVLRVVCDAVPDLKGYQAIQRFDPARLRLTAITPGDMLTGLGGAYAWFTLPDVTAPVDSAWMDAAMLDGTAHGPGVIEYLAFDALADGSTYVVCAGADLRDGDNVSTVPACIAAKVTVEGPVTAPPTTWGTLKTRYR